MNHDYAHCIDWCRGCPKDCFMAQLALDLEVRKKEFVGVPLTYASFYGTEECMREKETE